MIDRIIRFSLENRAGVLLVAACLAAAGFVSFRGLTVEAFPDPTDTQVQIITLFDGQPAEEVERRISIPLERELNGIPGLYRQRSISMFGLSFLTLTFDDGVDVYFARQQVVERMSQAELPEGVQPSLGPVATPIGEIYRYTLQSKTSDPMELRTLQDYVVLPRLLQVPGVAEVVSYGGLVKEVQVIPEPVRMAEVGVSLAEISQALERASSNASGGYLERGAEMFVIRSLGIFEELGDIEAVRVDFHQGRPVTLGEVATVRIAHAPRQGIVTRDEDEDAIQGIVAMRRGENPSVVLEALRQRIEEINENVLPEDVRIFPFYDRSHLVRTTLRTVFRNVSEGAILVCLVFFAFMLSLRASFIVAAIIPLSLATAFVFLRSRGMSANLLSLGAIDFGIVVDGAVIVVEHLFHRLAGKRKGASDADFLTAIRKSAAEVARPTLFAMMIIIAAYLPIFSMERVEGRIFAPMAYMVVSASAGALLLSFTLVPVLSFYALRSDQAPKESPLTRWIRRGYEPLLRRLLGRPAAVSALALGALAATLVLAGRLGTEFLPQLNEGALYATFALPQNVSLNEGRRLTPRIKRILRKTPEVQSILTQLGRPEDGTDDKLPSNLEMFIQLQPMKEWRRDMRKLDDLIEEMSERLLEIPGLEFNFSQPIRDNVEENISGQKGEVALKIYGEDLSVLVQLAETAKSAIAEVPGAADLALVKVGEVPQVSISLNRRALASYDLDLEDVQEHLQTALGGKVVNELWEGERRFDLSLRFPDTSREDIESIRRLRIPLDGGALLPLASVAEVKMAVGRAAITRENGRRYAGVGMNVRNRDLGSFVEEAQRKVREALDLPAGYELRWGGEFENQQRAAARLRVVIPLALLITFLLLFSAFRSLWDSAMILLHLPVALAGGVLALAIAGLPLSTSAAVGFIALLGQACVNSVLIVAAIRSRRGEGMTWSEASVAGSLDRLRAVVMTTLLACLGLVPAAFSQAIGSETQRPIAVVVVGGALSAALVSLLVLPVVYRWASAWRFGNLGEDEEEEELATG